MQKGLRQKQIFAWGSKNNYFSAKIKSLWFKMEKKMLTNVWIEIYG